ncbi:DUF4232 domain-containing protein [Leifsonia sp. ZF2019]|uniref:DUF4232 domain-containing protein n=1 Tax=Leifsonia sp. ZF2019 TaxID=2781978 RepID=UPI001CBB40AC|nr:DUF4232 domain-containing protein [Leifsonia sp. ZF2019]UAJ80071.1 DUF4232 domain-containing protein [Leifsonia sp. ZF2019]
MAITKNRFLAGLGVAGALIVGGVAAPSAAQASEAKDVSPCQFNQPNGQGAAITASTWVNLEPFERSATTFTITNAGSTACSIDESPVVEATKSDGTPIGASSYVQDGVVGQERVVIPPSKAAQFHAFYEEGSTNPDKRQAVDLLRVKINYDTVIITGEGDGSPAAGIYGPKDSSARWIETTSMYVKN